MEKVGFGDRGDDSGRFHAGVSRHPVGRPNKSYSMQEVQSGGIIVNYTRATRREGNCYLCVWYGIWYGMVW